MEFYYENTPVTPHHSRLRVPGVERGLKTVSFENARTPFPQKNFNSTANTPHPSKLDRNKSALQPRRVLADISNSNHVQQVNMPPKTATKATVKKTTVTKSVRFEEDVETCTRISKFKATPFRPEVERAVKIMSNTWMHDPEFQDENKAALDFGSKYNLATPGDTSSYEPFEDPSAFEEDPLLMI